MGVVVVLLLLLVVGVGVVGGGYDQRIDDGQ